MPPVISCLIPVFNGERFLRQALASVLAQSFGDFEVVAVNDGSTDNSLSILNEFAARDPRVRIVSRPNGGIVSALNDGLAHCVGGLIARMDCDDIALPDRFAVQLAVFRDRADAVAVGGLIQTIDENDRAISPPGSPSRVEATSLDCFPPVVANVQHSAGTFLKSALDAVGGYRRTFPHAEDYDLYLRLADHGRFYNPKSLVLFYRVHEASLSMRNLDRQETSAVLAEMSAYARRARRPDPGDADAALGIDDYAAVLGDLCPARTMRRYIDFRVWRRLAGARHPDEAPRRRAVLKGLVDRRNYASRFDRALNRRIVLSMGRKLARLARHDPLRLLGRGKAINLAR